MENQGNNSELNLHLLIIINYLHIWVLYIHPGHPTWGKNLFSRFMHNYSKRNPFTLVLLRLHALLFSFSFLQ